MQVRKRKLVLLPVVLSLSMGTAEASVLQRKNHQIGDSDDDSASFKLPQHTVRIVKPRVEKFSIRMDDRRSKIAEKALEFNLGDGASFIEYYEIDAEPLPPKPVKSSPSTVSLPMSSPYLVNGLAVVAIASFSTGHGIKNLKELLVGGIAALSLVWIPTMLVHGGWVEFVGVVSLFAHPSTRRLVLGKILPKTFATLKKLVVTEVWRLIWASVLAPVPKRFLVPPDDLIKRIHWLPDTIQEWFLYFRDKVDSFVMSTLKGSVQKSIHGSFGSVYDTVTVSMMYEESVGSVEEPSLIEDSDGDESADDGDDDDHTPQLVCDGDVCRFE